MTAVEEMSPTALVELLEHHPRRVAYHAPRNSVVLTGCSGVVKALLPITADQLAAVVAADL